ncbi:MAG: hypothetical protein E6767_03175 [Dysgonomonas sp.]|nr:hypothetical protein [Dysgonomonas sp.]
MEITIKGIPSESRINELLKAMSFISKAKEIMRKEFPDQEEIRKNEEYYKAIFEVESECGNATYYLGRAIGALTAYDLSEKY